MKSSVLHVIKIGGNIVDHPTLLAQFLTDFSAIDAPKILVHGGGKIATQFSEKMGIVPQLIDGRRITDAETLKIVTMVYGGLINKQIVAGLQARKCNAIGLTGADANIILSKKRQHPSIDFGFVGDVEQVNAGMLQHFISAGLSPIIAPLTHDGEGNILNTNADTVASTIAVAMSKIMEVKFFYCFEKKGLLLDINDNNSVLKHVQLKEIESLKNDGTIVTGMIPKVDNISNAIQAGVAQVVLCHAEDMASIIAGNHSFGTIFTA